MCIIKQRKIQSLTAKVQLETDLSFRDSKRLLQTLSQFQSFHSCAENSLASKEVPGTAEALNR